MIVLSHVKFFKGLLDFMMAITHFKKRERKSWRKKVEQKWELKKIFWGFLPQTECAKKHQFWWTKAFLMKAWKKFPYWQYQMYDDDCVQVKLYCICKDNSCNTQEKKLDLDKK